MRVGFAIVLLLATIAHAASAAEDPRPLREEDVVKMVAAGRPTPEIVEAIRSRSVAFDLSEEMLQELRLAAVPEGVIEAMQARVAATRARTPAAAPVLPDVPPVRVNLATAVEDTGLSAIYFPARLEDDMARSLELGPTPADREVHDIAIFLACLTASHVPDQWRTRSPLGRDFVSMPRHGILALQSGAVPIEASEVPRKVRSVYPKARADEDPPGWLKLDLPPALEGSLDGAEPHHLLLGVAILVGDHYMRVGSVEAKDVAAGPDGVTLKARVLEGAEESGDIVRLEIAPETPR